MRRPVHALFFCLLVATPIAVRADDGRILTGGSVEPTAHFVPANVPSLQLALDGVTAMASDLSLVRTDGAAEIAVPFDLVVDDYDGPSASYAFVPREPLVVGATYETRTSIRSPVLFFGSYEAVAAAPLPTGTLDFDAAVVATVNAGRVIDMQLIVGVDVPATDMTPWAHTLATAVFIDDEEFRGEAMSAEGSHMTMPGIVIDCDGTAGPGGVFAPTGERRVRVEVGGWGLPPILSSTTLANLDCAHPTYAVDALDGHRLNARELTNAGLTPASGCSIAHARTGAIVPLLALGIAVLTLSRRRR